MKNPQNIETWGRSAARNRYDGSGMKKMQTGGPSKGTDAYYADQELKNNVPEGDRGYGDPIPKSEVKTWGSVGNARAAAQARMNAEERSPLLLWEKYLSPEAEQRIIHEKSRKSGGKVKHRGGK